MVRRTRDLIAATGRKTSGDAILAAIALDLQDGSLDGQGARGIDPDVSAVAKVVSGQVLVEALANTLKVGGIIATPVIDQSIETTRPGISSDNLTQAIRITDGMLQQTRTALAAARAMDSSAEVAAIESIVSKISAGTMPATIATVLPADASRSLDNAVLLSSTADETQLAAVNASGEKTDSDNPSPAVPVPTEPVTTALRLPRSRPIRPPPGFRHAGPGHAGPHHRRRLRLNPSRLNRLRLNLSRQLRSRLSRSQATL